jgi:hypothetical protein
LSSHFVPPTIAEPLGCHWCLVFRTYFQTTT